MRLIDLCDRWGKLPSEVLAEPAEVLRMVDVADTYRRAVPDGG